jgi:hypothetical protein
MPGMEAGRAKLALKALVPEYTPYSHSDSQAAQTEAPSTPAARALQSRLPLITPAPNAIEGRN